MLFLRPLWQLVHRLLHFPVPGLFRPPALSARIPRSLSLFLSPARAARPSSVSFAVVIVFRRRRRRLFIFLEFPTPLRRGILSCCRFWHTIFPHSIRAKHVDASPDGPLCSRIPPGLPGCCRILATSSPSRLLPFGPKLLSLPCRDFVYFAITCYIKAAKSLAATVWCRVFFLFICDRLSSRQTTTSSVAG